MIRSAGLLIIVWAMGASPAFAQPKTDSLLTQLLNSKGSRVVQTITQQPLKYRCQIIYTQIERDKTGTPHFENYFFNYDPNLYFNPASMVKLPLALLALEKLNTPPLQGINKYTTIQYDSSFAGQTTAYTDSTSASGLPAIAHYIKRAFLISENDPYNRLYQFVGQQSINRNLHQKGYVDARITRQFMGFSDEQNRHTNAIRFVDSAGHLLLSQQAAYNTDTFNFSRTILLGKAHLNRNDSLVQNPFDFTRHNNVPLLYFQQMLQSLVFPASVPKKQRFQISPADRMFLLQYLSQYPSETNYPKYDTSLFYDSYVKFFFRDSTHKMPPGVRVFNKVGWSYGFLTDASYVLDTLHQVEYMLAATVYVNENETLNDGVYEYETLGHPFLYQLGQVIYNYELQRKRSSDARLLNPIIKYEQRDGHDRRPPVSIVDN